MKRIPALDGLRGVAILLVLLDHVFGERGGVLGVDLFFVLSGFLITSLLLDERTRTGAISLRGFYARRAVRLLPALLLMVVTVVAVAVATGRSTGRELAAAGIGLSYTSNVMLILNPHAVTSNFTHLWSLAEEEQFYLLWPPILILCLYRRWLPWAAAAAAVLSAVDLYFVADANVARFWPYAGPDTHASPIIVGCVAALLAARGCRVSAPVGYAAIAVTAALVVVQSLNLDPVPLWPPFAIGAALAVWWLAESSGVVARTLSVRPLVYVGAISYALYLWNSVVFAVFPFPPIDTVWLAVLLAAGSLRYVERPVLRWYRSRAGAKSSSAKVVRSEQPALPLAAQASP